MSGPRCQTFVIKIGTGVITDDRGDIDAKSMDNIVNQIVNIKNNGGNAVLVSSGAMGCGRGLLKDANEDTVAQRQILAAVGQAHLVQAYYEKFEKSGFVCAQILATKENFQTREQYRNMRACFEELLKNNIIPVVNENDVVSVRGLTFSDNDELAGMIAAMLNADALIMLTNVDGVFNGDPDDNASQLLPTIDPETFSMQACVLSEASKNGKGGMCAKCEIAAKIALMGIPAHIANGRRKNVVVDIVNGENIGTLFIPKKRASVGKRWVGMCDGQEKGTIFINSGAVAALHDESKATSVLPVGVVGVLGDFNKGDIVKICTANGTGIATGMAECSDEAARETMGKRDEKPVVHYDYLFLYT